MAAAASDWVAEIDVASQRLTGEHPAPGTPLGVAVSGDGSWLLVSRFRAERVDRYRLPVFVEDGRIEVGPGASLFWGPLPDGRWLVSIERGDKMRVIDGENMETIDVHPVGKRPFPPAATSDGTGAFVNNTASHDVSVVALAEKKVVARIPVGEIPIVMAVHPSGETLWVASEGSHEVTVVSIPESWRAGR